MPPSVGRRAAAAVDDADIYYYRTRTESGTRRVG
jgi:hypothetical protein